MSKTVFITGCSSGIGRAAAKHFQARGWNVVATLRTNPAEDEELNALDNVLVVQLDVTEEDTVKAGVEAAIERFGRIDVLVNNAGYGAYGVLEATSPEAIKRQFDVNVIGLLSMTREVIPGMRKAGSGTIINISSIGGKVTFPFGSLYHGTKFAVEGITEALSYELEAIGVKARLVEPGMIETNFGETTMSNFSVDPEMTEYMPLINGVMAGFEAMSGQGSQPELVAEVIYGAATDTSDTMRYLAGADAEQIIAARTQLNDRDYMAAMRSQLGLEVS